MNADAIDEPTEEAGRRWMKASDTLAGDLNVCAKLTKLRGWKTATVHDLAVEGSLGFEDGKLCFLYDSGMKVRCRRNDERIIFWAFGKPWIWRGSFLSIPSRQKIFICEGETDAIRLLDLGAERDDPTKLIVAVPSASTFNENWARLFKDKDVVLAFDDDEAGRKATDRVANILRGHVRSLATLDWKGLRQAHAC